VIEHDSMRHYVRVAATKPAHTVSILGSVDLEVDFEPLADAAGSAAAAKAAVPQVPE